VEIPVSAATAISHENQLNEVVSDEAILTSSGESKPPIENQHYHAGITMEETQILDLSENVSYVSSKTAAAYHKFQFEIKHWAPQNRPEQPWTKPKSEKWEKIHRLYTPSSSRNRTR
jgi:hypothetical protein